MTVSRDMPVQGGLEQIPSGSTYRVESLTGIRAVAALLVMVTHAAFTTGKYPEGYFGSFWSRTEIGVPIFFVLSGFLLFRPWVQASRKGRPGPSLLRYTRHRIRRIMPAYVVTVLAAYAVYHFRAVEPNPGHTVTGLFRNLTLTQIYTDNYVYSYLHQGLTQMWSLAVEVGFYIALPFLAYVLLVLLCRRQWRPYRLLAGLAVAAAISPAWLILVHTVEGLPDGARLWPPAYLMWFVGGMTLTVLQALNVRAYGFAVIPLAVICYAIASTPVAGEPTTTPRELAQALVKVVFYAVIAALAVAPLALGDRGWYAWVLGTRPMVWLGEISYEMFLIHMVLIEIAMVDVLHWRIWTGSMWGLFAVTVVMTVPLAWLLHYLTWDLPARRRARREESRA
ncbi:acyltransferase [Mycobacterium koreense]|uniref:Acyltransferase n=1 Tax=Mycolicibacillus koreensis TaxID=1069220 RepID=A0A7I7S9G7_9MYCO|nr:acyltransferase [Mycolicibacillus koreensis]MCV7249780.1 acyltransferase [Mycolicibacillus koreensis]ODR08837.1 acyltransferase [Mycolicibacillus koreensis]OSC32679.1 acyltransferase [Mycolicibacillus koreensis]BBY52856.1 acyltransferase [Mycolicibacillus koreensis]